MDYTNIVFIALIAEVLILVIFFFFKRDSNDKNDKNENFTIEYLQDRVKVLIDDLANQNISALGLSSSETKKRYAQKSRMNNALRSCASNNSGSREYVKDYIRDILQKHLCINEKTIDLVIPFYNADYIPSYIKSVILYTLKDYGSLCKKYHMDHQKECEEGYFYEINSDDIEDVYRKEISTLTYLDKLNVLTQLIFQNTYGNSVADIYMYDNTIDGVSGGCSGVSNEQYNYMEEIIENNMVKPPKSFESLWIYYKGKPIHHTYLSFGAQEELIRVCNNLYVNGSVGHLHSQNGVKQTHLVDGSRCVVARPNYASHWCFFVRKFNSCRKMKIADLYPYENVYLLECLMKWSIKGMANIIYSGDANSGKTTFMKNSLFRFTDLRYPIRTAETDFELWANNIFPNLNVSAFRKTGNMSMVDVIYALKKMDAAIIVLGEVASMEETRALLELILSGTKMVACTIHTPTVDKLMQYLRASLMGKDGGFSNEMIAEEQVATSINLDIHCVKGAGGKRYIDRISEIIPIKEEEGSWPKDTMEIIAEGIKRLSRKKTYTYRNILEFKNGKFEIANPLSDELAEKILNNLEDIHKNDFLEFHQRCKDLCICNKKRVG